jgi:hypothetical protein
MTGWMSFWVIVGSVVFVTVVVLSGILVELIKDEVAAAKRGQVLAQQSHAEHQIDRIVKGTVQEMFNAMEDYR